MAMKKILLSLAGLVFLALSLKTNANDCATANLITSEEDFLDSQVTGSFSGAGFSGITQCVGPGGRPDVWYRFVAVASDHGIFATGSGDINIAIQVFDACSGTQLACRNNSGPGGTEIALVSNLTPGNTYYYTVFHAGGAPATATDFTTAVAHIPFVELESSYCGVTDYTSNDVIRATIPSNTTNFTNYQFRFVELEPPFSTYIITSPNGTNPNFLLEWFPALEYGRTYEVSVRVRAVVQAYGDFGNTCTIGIQEDVLTTRLESQYQNGFFDFCDIVGANKVALATQYRWTFLNLDDLSNSEVIGLDDSRLLNLYRVPDLELGTTYAVGVFATVAGEESPSGTLSFLNMNNAVPNTGINTNLYPCGQTYAISQFIEATEVCRAEAYTWRFTNTSQAQAAIVYTRSDGSRFVDLDFVPGLIVGDSYDVEVRADQGGLSGDYSTICNITIGESENPNLVRIVESDELEGEDTYTHYGTPDWEVDVYPSGNGPGTFNLVLSSEDVSQRAFVEVFDLNGRRLSVNEPILNVGDLELLDLSVLNAGIYVIRVYNGTKQITQKVATF